MKILQEQEQTASYISRILTAFKTSEGTIKPHFVITGNSGTGKSYLVSKLAAENKLDIIHVNAAQVTQEGVSGNSLSKVLSPLADTEGRLTVVFIDEFDKWFTPDSKGSINVATTAIQNEFLKLLESDSTEVFGNYGKYVSVSLERVLFVFAGAFNGKPVKTTKDLLDLGVKKEFVGRVALLTETSPLSLESLLTHLKQSQLLQDYCKVFPEEKKSKAVAEISKNLSEAYSQNVLGIRLVSNLIHQYFIK